MQVVVCVAQNPLLAQNGPKFSPFLRLAKVPYEVTAAFSWNSGRAQLRAAFA
jgi:hypothetical protein